MSHTLRGRFDIMPLTFPLIPEIVVIVVFTVAGLGCVAYSVTRWRRKSQALFGWLFLPCFNVVRVYVWFITAGIPLAERATQARLAFILFGTVIAVTMFVASWLNYKLK